MARIKGGMIRVGSGNKKKKTGKLIKRRGAVAYRKAEGSPEPLRAARILAGY